MFNVYYLSPGRNSRNSFISGYILDDLQPMLEQKRQAYEKTVVTRTEWKALLEHVEWLNEHRSKFWAPSSLSDAISSNGRPSMPPFETVPFKMMVDIGAGYRQEAHIPQITGHDDTGIYINIGADVYLHFSLPEALMYTQKKLESLDKQLKTQQADLVAIQTDVMVSMAAIQSLVGSSASIR
jgi:hypothetical protein